MAKKKKEDLKNQNVKEENSNILLPSKVDVESVRDELKNYIDAEINKVFFDELEKSNKKLVREKSRRIFWKNIIIIILLLIIGFLLYLLYSNNYFDKYFNKESNIQEKETNIVSPTPIVTSTPVPTFTPTPTPSQEDLKKEFAGLLDDYYVLDNSIYLDSFYNGKLTSEIKKYITLNSFDFSIFEKEEDYNIIKESIFKTMYLKLFDSDYESSSFDFDDNKIRYVKAMESYMTSSLLVKEDSNIKREIKDIKLDGKNVIITTIEGLVKDNKLYNILTNDEIVEYKEDSLLKYEDKLNKLVYTFNGSKLINLSK